MPIGEMLRKREIPFYKEKASVDKTGERRRDAQCSEPSVYYINVSEEQ